MTFTLPDPPPASPKIGRSGLFDDALRQMMDLLFEPLAEGVEGLVRHPRPGMFELAGIRATTPRIPGAVGRYLDQLPQDQFVLVPFVVSDRLGEMLGRRGFIGPTDEDHWFRLPEALR